MLKLHRDKTDPKPLTFGRADGTVVLASTGRFAGLDPVTAKDQGLYGFIYRVTILHKSRSIADEYVGSKAFGKNNDWKTYCTSSQYVKPILERALVFGGPDITFEILGYGYSKGQLHAIECSYIMECRKRKGSRYCLNKALANGDLLSKQSTYTKYKREHKAKSNVRYT